MFTFDGIHSDSLNINVNYPNINSIPAVRNYLDFIDGKDGLYDYGLNFKERYITFNCNFIANTVTEALAILDNINKFFNPKDGAKELILDYLPDRYCMARLYNALDVSRIIANYKNGGEFELIFLVADPFYYSIAEYNQQYTSDGSYEFDVGGTYETLPVITIIADIAEGDDNIQFNFNNLFVLEIQSVMETTYYLEVDCKNRTIKYIEIATEDEEVGLIYVYKIAFPPLVVGTNYLEITDNDSCLTSIDIDYRRRYF